MTLPLERASLETNGKPVDKRATLMCIEGVETGYKLIRIQPNGLLKDRNTHDLKVFEQNPAIELANAESIEPTSETLDPLDLSCR